jgi:hypothetical protein
LNDSQAALTKNASRLDHHREPARYFCVVLRLSDHQMDSVLLAAKPIPVRLRDAFLNTVVEIVRPRMGPDGSVGDGDLFRAVKEAQRRHFDPPLDAPGHGHRGAYHPAID